MSLPGRLIELPSGRVFAVTRPGPKGPAGADPVPLLLLHGYLQSHYVFLPVLDCLQQERPLVLLDLPGHGESDRPSPLRFAYDLPSLAESVRGAMEALSIERAALLGHSLGGAVALTLAARHPARCERLVLVGPVLYPVELPPLVRLLRMPIVGPILFKGVVGKSDLRRLLLRQIYRDPALVTADKVDYCWERMNRAGSREALHAIMQANAVPAPENPDIARVRVPTLLVWGEEDRMAPLRQGKLLCEAIAGARLTVIPGSGHNPFEERPGEFCQAVTPFLHTEGA